MMEIEGTPIEPDKSQNILATLREHLMIAFPHLSISLPLNQIRNDTAGNISMVMPLRSKAEPTGSTHKGYINMGLPLDTPTFMLQFTPIAIIPDEDNVNLSSKTVIDVSVATYHGVILKKDYLTFSIHYNNPSNLDEAELRTTTCDLLSKLEVFADSGFRLCCGLENIKGLNLNEVFIEPFGESRDGLIITRSRKCEFMLEMEEMYSSEKVELDRNSCLQCGMLQNQALCIKVKNEFQSNKNNEFQVDDESDSDAIEHPSDDDLNPLEDEANEDKDPNWKRISVSKKSTLDQDFYSCSHCSKKFKTQRALQRHKEYEASNSKWKCEKCGKKFKNDIILKTHKCSRIPAMNVELKTGKKRKKRGTINRIVKREKITENPEDAKKEYCHLCFRDFTMQTRFEQHMELHKKRIEHLFEETLCPLENCGQTFPDRIQLSAHFNDHDQENSPCAYCLKVLKKEKMRAHVFAEHPYQQFQCNICNKICSFQSQLKQHTIGNFCYYSSGNAADVIKTNIAHTVTIPPFIF